MEKQDSEFDKMVVTLVTDFQKKLLEQCKNLQKDCNVVGIELERRELRK